MSQVIFEGWANVYKYDDGESICDCAVFGYELQEQAQHQFDAQGKKEKDHSIEQRPRRVRVEILD
jgi:hypothetical protein